MHFIVLEFWESTFWADQAGAGARPVRPSSATRCQEIWRDCALAFWNSICFARVFPWPCCPLAFLWFWSLVGEPDVGICLWLQCLCCYTIFLWELWVDFVLIVGSVLVTNYRCWSYYRFGERYTKRARWLQAQQAFAQKLLWCIIGFDLPNRWSFFKRYKKKCT